MIVRRWYKEQNSNDVKPGNLLRTPGPFTSAVSSATGGAYHPGVRFVRNEAIVGKRKLGDDVVTPELLIERMAQMGLPVQARMVALTIYLHPQTQDPPRLARLAGVPVRQFEVHRESLQGADLLGPDGWTVQTPPDPARGRKTALAPSPPEARQTVAEDAVTFLTAYRRRWVDRYGGRCFIPANDQRAAREFIREVGIQDAMARLDGYMADEDQWLKKNAHPIRVFFMRSNQYQGGTDAGKAERIAEHGDDFDAKVTEFEEQQRRKPDK